MLKMKGKVISNVRRIQKGLTTKSISMLTVSWWAVKLINIMAYLTFVTALVLLVAIQCTSVNACGRRKRRNDGTPYYLGEMSLPDAKKGKRKRDIIWPWTLTHSMIRFRGNVFEWGINKTYYMNRSPSSSQIWWHRGAKGHSKCLLSDVKSWTKAYGRSNTYHILANNCHMFVNRLAKYLNTNCGR
ncbi:Hypothetical predicted protein [Paramuricea clavata]|uniref:Uncharacterized protein n=2 Tax=Paramuricea clavata TaxID=317549 RepID=A0A6S7HFQ8_PARCT|nr:Hypothetical predicted protein [Paramuricea clavata]